MGDLLQLIIFGIIQGVTEWLPISSEGMIVLVKTRFFPDSTTLAEFLKVVLMLHLGTFFAALIYLWSDVSKLFKTAFNYRKSDNASRKLLNFIILSTVISGVIGFAILSFISSTEGKVAITGKAITLFVGFLLLGTASIQIRSESSVHNDQSKLSVVDSLILGIGQGLSTLPGVSRSGTTSSLLLLRNYEKSDALRISFLMSLPIVLAGNIFLNWNSLTGGITIPLLAGLLASFIFGLATIHLLFKLARKMNFGWFVMIIGLLTIIAGLMS
jgi:undecaprenyl-diphosphatase